MSKEIKQLFFDCDNTLVLSEDVAFTACADLANQLLAEYNVSDRYTSEQLIIEFIGQTFRGMMRAFQTKYHFTMSPEKVDYYVKQEEIAVVTNLAKKAVPCEDSITILDKLAADNQYGLAVVSSSAIRRIRASLDKTGQAKYFPYDNVYSAVSSLPQPASKPDPAIYVHAMEQLNVKPDECIAVEDSRSGARAAINAGIPCIAYVGAYTSRQKQDMVASTLLAIGCKVVMYNWSEFFSCIEQLQEVA